MKPTTKKPTKKAALKKAAKKAAPKKAEKKPAFLHIADEGDVINFGIQGKPADLLAIIKGCMESNETFSQLIKIAAII